MIVRVLKKLYQKAGDFALRDELGNMICKTAYIGAGYYIYNKRGQQVAQLVFQKNSATMSVVSSVPAYPGAIRMSVVAPDSFVFDANVIDKGDDQFVKNVKGRDAKRFSLWGVPSAYSFDIFDGPERVGEVIPYPADDDVYQIRTFEETNLLYVLMICLAQEKLNADFGKKR